MNVYYKTFGLLLHRVKLLLALSLNNSFFSYKTQKLTKLAEATFLPCANLF